MPGKLAILSPRPSARRNPKRPLAMVLNAAGGGHLFAEMRVSLHQAGQLACVSASWNEEQARGEH